VSGATREYGIGRTRLYELMSSGKLPDSQAAGGRRLIPRIALRRLLAAGLVGVDHPGKRSTE